MHTFFVSIFWKKEKNGAVASQPAAPSAPGVPKVHEPPGKNNLITALRTQVCDNTRQPAAVRARRSFPKYDNSRVSWQEGGLSSRHGAEEPATRHAQYRKSTAFPPHFFYPLLLSRTPFLKIRCCDVTKGAPVPSDAGSQPCAGSALCRRLVFGPLLNLQKVQRNIGFFEGR